MLKNKRVKSLTRTCGKCGKTFPVGQGHNARTCIKNKTPHTLNPFPPQTRTIQEPARATKVSLTVRGGEQENFHVKRTVPHKNFEAIGVSPRSGKVVTRNNKWGDLPQEWLTKYNHIEHGGDSIWFNEEGKPHRLNGPAVEYAKGRREWRVNGKQHRLDGPAVENENGYKEWRVNGEKHRLDGPAVEWANGDKEWWVNGLNMEEHADHPSVPEMMGKYFYFLCINKNPHIRKKALANPNCPIEFKIVNKVLKN